jgi:hypothetical protein
VPDISQRCQPLHNSTARHPQSFSRSCDGRRARPLVRVGTPTMVSASLILLVQRTSSV